ncbi:MAG: glycosyltransferase family 4 protein, partial [Candidatus Hydrogenedentes bacterium]|nr:glycosyltransferase family 4 protein [Candidatus Hydrogenedentota bacterium]
MRVLMNALNGGNRSGTGRYISELAKALVDIEDENDYRFLWPRNLTAPFPDCESHFIRSSTAPLVRFFYEYRGMDGIAGRTQSDLVHYPTGIGPKFSKIPTVLTVHDMCFFHHPEWFSRSRALYYRITMAAGIRSADHLIADSQATAEDIMHFLDIPESRIDVVPLGVDTCFHPASSEEIRQVRQVYKLPERFFLFVGTLEPRKNLGRLIKAWTGVCDKVPSLVIAGRYGWGDSGLTG